MAATEALDALRREGIPGILLKGPSLATWLYEGRADRPYSDADLLVAKRAHQRAERILESLGYDCEPIRGVPGDRTPEATEWRRDDGMLIDLHFTLVGPLVPPEDVWEVLSRHVIKMALRGGQVDILDIPARALHVAMHAAQHGPGKPQPLRDLELALNRLPDDVWIKAVTVARELCATDAMVAGLAMFPKGRTLVERLDLQPPTDIDVVLRASSAPPAALNVQTLASLPSRGAKLRLIAGKLFPPPSFLRNRSKLARRGPLGLAAAYAARPFVVVARLGPGLVAWARARRKARY